MRFTILIVLLLASYEMVLGLSYADIPDDVPDPLTLDISNSSLKHHVRFYLYSRTNPNNSHELFVGDELSVQRSTFNASKATKFITHGWQNDNTSAIAQLLPNAFLTHGDYNVIFVDWGLTAMKDYITAATAVRKVGIYVAQMIDLVVNLGTNPVQMTLAGHSLGAHVMGLAGYNAKSDVAQLVGMDPARPGFRNAGPEGRISPEDADYVEIIHTNAGNLGLRNPTGHADYYPNGGGPRQPGCGLDPTGSCAHSRSYMYYAGSLARPDAWLAIKCNTTGEFKAGECKGHLVEPFPRWRVNFKKPGGVYRLRTNATEPFGLGWKGTRPSKKTKESALTRLAESISGDDAPNISVDS